MLFCRETGTDYCHKQISVQLFVPRVDFSWGYKLLSAQAEVMAATGFIKELIAVVSITSACANYCWQVVYIISRIKYNSGLYTDHTTLNLDHYEFTFF